MATYSSDNGVNSPSIETRSLRIREDPTFLIKSTKATTTSLTATDAALNGDLPEVDLPSITFHLFPKLPIELRHEIWRHAGSEPLILRLRYDGEKYSIYARRNVMLACKEANEEVKGHFKFEKVKRHNAIQFPIERNGEALVNFSKDVFYLQLQWAHLYPPDRDQKLARHSAIQEYVNKHGHPIGMASNWQELRQYEWKYKFLLKLEHKYDTQLDYLSYCLARDDYWDRFTNVAINLSLLPFDFPYGTENEVFNGNTRVARWASVAVYSFMNDVMENLMDGTDFPGVETVYFVVPEKEDPEVAEENAKKKQIVEDRGTGDEHLELTEDGETGQKKQWHGVTDLGSQYDFKGFRYAWDGETGLIPWAEARGTLVYTDHQLQLIQETMQDWRDTREDGDGNKAALPKFEIVVADYKGRST